MAYELVTTLAALKEYLKPLLEGETKVVAFDFETSPIDEWRGDKDVALDPHKADITGVSLSIAPRTGIYVPIRHQTGKNAEDIGGIMLFLSKEIFQNKHIIKVAHNLSFEAMFLYKYGVVVLPPVYDTIAAAQLTLKEEMGFRELKDCGLKTLVPVLFNVELPTYSEVTEGKHFDELDPEDDETVRYACADSDFALQLYYRFNEWFDRFLPKHRFICEEIESPTAVYTGIMKYNGIAVDRELMEQKKQEAEQKLAELKQQICEAAGRELDIGANAATDEFKRFLYEELKLPVVKTTAKFAEAADDETMVLLKEWCAVHNPVLVRFFELIQEYRKWGKIKSTYIDGYLQYINETTGRIHPDLFPLGTDTGRFASRKPNLQNAPRKDNDPIGVRNFFVARPGYKFLDFDFSQIELRVGAYFCRDKRMLEVYQKGGDIHAQTTSVIYKIPFEQAVDKAATQYKERRAIAKNCNFGVFFGLFPRGLQRTLKFKAGLEASLEKCEQIIRNLKNGYPGLMRWQAETKRRAAIRKYAETALGRRRYLKGIDSEDWGVKSYWERCALNTPIQGTAADILKLALQRILEGLPERPYIKPLLQIHDELLFEVEEDKVSETADFIKACMEAVPFPEFDVPIKAEGAVGVRFGELEEMEG
ncbi:hypothetical protein JCM39194_10810 [Desulfotomaculum varum]